MGLKTQNTLGSRVYDLSNFGGCSVFDRVRGVNRRKIARKETPDASEVVLLQDLEFPISSQCVKVSPDGNFVVATGVYAPEVRIFDVNSLGLKCKRGLDFAVTDFVFLEDDFRKLAFLQRDRWLELHAQGGRHHRLRIPREGTALTYLPWVASVCCSSSGKGDFSSVYLLDLEDGRFLQPWKSQVESGLCCFHSQLLPLVAVGGTGGKVEFFDYRIGTSVASLNLNNFAPRRCVSPEQPKSSLWPLPSRREAKGGSRLCVASSSVTSGAFSPWSLEVCLGCSDGSCWIFDLRSATPRLQFKHRNFSAVRTLQWLSLRGSSAAAVESLRGGGALRAVASADDVSLRVWASEAGGGAPSGRALPPCAAALAAVEAPVVSEAPVEKRDVGKRRQGAAALPAVAPDSSSGQRGQLQRVVHFNAFAFYPDSGLCFVAAEHKSMGLYFLPRVGPAPKWCSMLEGITEELEASQFATAGSAAAAAGSAQASLEFVTESQLQQLGGAQNLLGTPLLRRYLHGFLIDADLHRTLKAASEPFAFEEYRKKRMQERLEQKKKMRIQIKHKLPKTNAEFAEKLQKAAQKAATSQRHLSKKEQREGAVATELLRDSRFEKLFSNPAFELEA